jgi:hypothetical protein
MRPLALAALLCSSLALASPPDVAHASVVVVRGSADHMEQVLAKAGVAFVAVNPEDVAGLALNAKQVLMVNCRGTLSPEAQERVRRFVSAGGFLYTTDHAVGELVQKIFPNTIAWTGGSTNEEVVPVKVRGSDADRGLLSSLGGNAKEYWQVAGGGYPVKVLDPKRVSVLMESDEAAKKYGSGVIAVRFPYADGQVIHVTGHFFSQPGQLTGTVASAGRGFETFSANVVRTKEADGARIDSLYGSTTQRGVQLQAAPAPTAAKVSTMGSSTTGELKQGTKLRLLEKKDDYAKVRDSEGNEGWVPANSL